MSKERTLVLYSFLGASSDDDVDVKWLSNETPQRDVKPCGGHANHIVWYSYLDGRHTKSPKPIADTGTLKWLVGGYEDQDPARKFAEFVSARGSFYMSTVQCILAIKWLNESLLAQQWWCTLISTNDLLVPDHAILWLRESWTSSGGGRHCHLNWCLETQLHLCVTDFCSCVDVRACVQLKSRK